MGKVDQDSVGQSRVMVYTEAQQARFWAHVNKTDDCWLWTAKIGGSHGSQYGQCKIGGKTRLAHRVSIEIARGRSIAHGMVVCHEPLLCHNSICVRPDHLREDTPSANMADKRTDGTLLYGASHPNARLTEDQVRTIKSDPRSQPIIGVEYGISHAQVGRIKRGESWGHIS